MALFTEDSRCVLRELGLAWLFTHAIPPACVFLRLLDVWHSILSRVSTCLASDSSKNKHEPNTDNYGLIINCTRLWKPSAGKRKHLCVANWGVDWSGATPRPLQDHMCSVVFLEVCQNCPVTPVCDTKRAYVDACVTHSADSLQEKTYPSGMCVSLCVCVYLGMCATWLPVCPQAHLSKWVNVCTC